MKVLSLFDGMSCGMLAMMGAGIKVDRYVAFEIDKYAIQTSSHNFPFIEHKGDVFQADFTEFRGFDFLVGGSPCTYWSIAQKNNRETEASGMGWELFSQDVRALREAQPMYFIYENNKSMSKAIRESITETFGFEPVCINSALVSAQNRQRLYWVGKRDADGTYRKVRVDQPEDRGILLKDILDGMTDREKGRCLLSSAGRTTTREYFIKNQGNMALEPVNPLVSEKARCVTAGYANKGAKHILESNYSENPSKQQWDSVAEPVNTTPDGKAVNIKAQAGGAGAKTGLYALQCCPMVVNEATAKGYTEINPGECVDLTQMNSKTRRGRNMADKPNCLMTSCQYYQYCGVLGYATPCEWDENGIPTKAVSAADGKTYDVYEVKDGMITIKGKQYPIKLVDGFYIIRKLTVTECMRLQTVPEWYEFPVSDSQAYKQLGNGWTVEVIIHLINSIMADVPETDEQLRLF